MLVRLTNLRIHSRKGIISLDMELDYQSGDLPRSLSRLKQRENVVGVRLGKIQ